MKEKNRNRKNLWIAALLGLLLFVLAGCGQIDESAPVTEAGSSGAETMPPEAEIGAAPEETEASRDIILLFTNDTHADVNAGLGFSGVAAIKKQLLETNEYVKLVDCGDHTQGTNLAAVSDGLYPVQIMNEAGYDYATYGNHEFDYGLETVRTNTMAAKFQYLCCNVSYTGKGTTPFFGVKPYEILDFGGTKVALIGVVTPRTATAANPGSLKENGETVVSFYGQTAEEYYEVVQENVDECRRQGADYVILLAHAGDNIESEGDYGSDQLIGNTTGIDVVLDGHSHSLLPQQVLVNKNGEKVIRSSTGSRLQSVGELIITPEGNIVTTVITAFPEKDEKTQEYIDRIKEAYEEEMKVVIGTSDYLLTVCDEEGVANIRTRETNLGDLCADALRSYFDAKISLKHSGSIRADIPAGDLTRGSILTAQPFNNTSVLIRTSGEHILEALEMGARKTKSIYKDKDGNLTGDNAGFLQVSGLRFTVDTSVESGVQTDASGNFLGIEGERRVTKVQVEEEDGSWTNLDPEADYTVALPANIALDGQDGMTMFQSDEVLSTGPVDYDLLAQYIEKTLGGVIPEQYEKAQGRIKIR